MIGRSRPLRFVMMILGGWTGARIALLWPAQGPVPPATAAPLTAIAVREEEPAPAPAIVPPPIVSAVPMRRTGNAPLLPDTSRPREAAPPQPTVTVTIATAQASPAIGAPLLPPPSGEAHRSRLGGSFWLLARGSGPAVPFAPQLGGSQTGIRLTYALGDSRRVAIAARLSSALATKQREAAIGLDWQPTRLPVHIFAEQRIAIAGTRGGPSAGVIAGLPPVPVAAGFALDAYGQGGGIARDGGEYFADGAARVMRTVAAGKARVELGLGAWGGAQRGASRLDVGPAASVVVPAGVPLRISLEWRQRIAGDARPGSGLALSIGADL